MSFKVKILMATGKKYMPWVLILFFLLAPIVFLLVRVVVEMFQNGLPDGTSIFSNRLFDLFVNSLILALLVAVFTLILGLSISWIAVSGWGSKSKHLKWLFLFFATIPAYILASLWLDFFYWVNISPQGLWPSFWVQSMTFLPMMIVLLIVGFELIDQTQVDAARMFSHDHKVLAYIIWPGIRPYAIAAFGVVFVFSLLDYTLPTIFQYPVFSLEILEEYSASGNLVLPIIKSLLLGTISLPILISSVLAFIKGLEIRKLSFPIDLTKFNNGKLIKAIKLLLLGFIPIFILVPLFLIFFEADFPSGLMKAFSRHWDLVISSFGVSAISALMITFLSFWLVSVFPLKKKISWVLILISLCLPPTMIGMALQVFWNQGFAEFVYSSRMMLILVNIMRFGPIGILILYLFYQYIPNASKEAAMIFQRGIFWRLLRIDLPLMMPGLITTFVLILILCLGEVGASISVMPPGGETISIRIFNYLHYGAGEMVSSLALLMLFFLICCFALNFLFRFMWKKTHSDK